VVKIVTSLLPTPVTDGMMATEMPEVIRPYSTAAAPESFFRTAAIFPLAGFLCCLPARVNVCAH